MDIRTAFLTGVNSRKAGGLFFTVYGMANQLISKDNVAVIGYKDQFSEVDSKEFDPKVQLIWYRLFFQNGLKVGVSLDILERIQNYSPQIIHQQGIWQYYSRAAFLYRKKKQCKLIVQPHGMLDGWALKNSSLKKKIVAFLYENQNLKIADCLHALNFEEYRSIRKFGLKNPVAVIPNGIDLPEEDSEPVQKNKNVLLYIGRIHPKKGLELLVEAVRVIKDQHPELLHLWEIRISGWSQNRHEEQLKEKVKNYGLQSNIFFIGAVFDKEKNEELRKADGFVLPSYSEGLPMSVLEAWSYKIPVLMTKECNLSEGFDRKAALLLKPNPENIAEIITNFMQFSVSERKEMGIKGYELVKEKYSWKKIADQIQALYNWLLGKSDQPTFVYID